MSWQMGQEKSSSDRKDIFSLREDGNTAGLQIKQKIQQSVSLDSPHLISLKELSLLDLFMSHQLFQYSLYPQCFFL